MTAIEYRKVCKQFPGSHAYALQSVSAGIEEGEFITILGSSGCSKTTLLKMTNRLYEPDSGEILLFGENIPAKDPVELHRGMGYVIQQVGLFPHLTVEENIGMTERQILTRVQIPLAKRALFAGLRTMNLAKILWGSLLSAAPIALARWLWRSKNRKDYGYPFESA